MRELNPTDFVIGVMMLAAAVLVAAITGASPVAPSPLPAMAAEAQECDATIRRWTEGGPAPITLCVQAGGFREWTQVDQSLPQTGGYTHYWHRSGRPVCLFTTDQVGEHRGGGRDLYRGDAPTEQGQTYVASIAPGYYTWAQASVQEGTACANLSIPVCSGVCGDWVGADWLADPH